MFNLSISLLTFYKTLSVVYVQNKLGLTVYAGFFRLGVEHDITGIIR